MTDALKGLDFDVKVLCVGTGCGRPAEWALTISCPSQHGSLMCRPHRDAWVAMHPSADRASRGVCTECPDQPDLPRPYFTWRGL